MSQKDREDPVEEARLLLPWYITGKLSEAEKQLVEQMLEQDAGLRADYQREINLVGLIRQNNSLLTLTAVDTTQQWLDKLMKRIEREAAPRQEAVAPVQAVTETVVKPTGAQKTTKTKSTFSFGVWWKEWWAGMDWLTPANAVFASLVVLQAGLLGGYWYMSQSAQPHIQPLSIYESASVTDEPAPVAAGEGVFLLIDFNDQAKMHQIREFLLQWDAHIIDGPDDNNLFKIRLGRQPLPEKRLDLLLQQMKKDQDVVSFVGQAY